MNKKLHHLITYRFIFVDFPDSVLHAQPLETESVRRGFRQIRADRELVGKGCATSSCMLLWCLAGMGWDGAPSYTPDPHNSFLSYSNVMLLWVTGVIFHSQGLTVNLSDTGLNWFSYCPAPLLRKVFGIGSQDWTPRSRHRLGRSVMLRAYVWAHRFTLHCEMK